MKLYKLPPPVEEDGLIRLTVEGNVCCARLTWRGSCVSERMPLHFYKMSVAAQEMEARRVTMKLIKKMKKICGSAPKNITEGKPDDHQGNDRSYAEEHGDFTPGHCPD